MCMWLKALEGATKRTLSEDSFVTSSTKWMFSKRCPESEHQCCCFIGKKTTKRNTAKAHSKKDKDDPIPILTPKNDTQLKMKVKKTKQTNMSTFDHVPTRTSEHKLMLQSRSNVLTVQTSSFVA